MANVLSMALRIRFKTLMDCGLCAAAAGKTLLLRRHGYTYKKGMIARERDTPEVRKARHDRGRHKRSCANSLSG